MYSLAIVYTQLYSLSCRPSVLDQNTSGMLNPLASVGVVMYELVNTSHARSIMGIEICSKYAEPDHVTAFSQNGDTRGSHQLVPVYNFTLSKQQGSSYKAMRMDCTLLNSSNPSLKWKLAVIQRILRGCVRTVVL